MTIGQIVEGLYGKVAAIKGEPQDGTPFSGASLEEPGNILAKYGFNRYGTHYFYDGITGELLPYGIYFCPTFYQRLRHMGHAKIHSRSTGPVSVLTNQPVEGRSRHGGLRLGGMELDCMVSYGASNVIKERMYEQSDPYVAPVCAQCGLLAIAARDPSSQAPKRARSNLGGMILRGSQNYCRNCKRHDTVHMVEMPYALKLLIQELYALGLAPRLRLNVRVEQNEDGQGQLCYYVNDASNLY